LSLKQKAITGVKWTTLSAIVNAILQLLQLSILARYLSASDFGLVAILMVIISLGQVFVDFGLSQAIIHKKQITSTQLSTLYWLNILLSLFVVGVIVLVSPLISNFYHEISLNKYIIIVSVSLIIQAFGQQYRALFQKELQFNLLAKIDIGAALISFFVSILMAINGFGILALIYPVIIMAFIKTIFLVFKGIKIHKPQMILNIQEAKPLLSFGAYTVGDGFINTISSQVDVIIIGKLLGTEVLGAYNIIKEYILKPSQLINPILTKVAFPTMSKVNHDIGQVKTIYLKLINYTASINFPIYVLNFLLSHEIIYILLGKQWLQYENLFQILAVWALMRSIGNPVGTLLLSTGKVQYGLYWNTGMLVYMPIMVYISSFWGIDGIAWGNVISILILFIPGWYFLIYKLCNAKLSEYVKSFIMPLVIVLFIGFCLFFIVSIFQLMPLSKILFVMIAGSAALYVMYKKYNHCFYALLILFFQDIVFGKKL